MTASDTLAAVGVGVLVAIVVGGVSITALPALDNPVMRIIIFVVAITGTVRWLGW